MRTNKKEFNPNKPEKHEVVIIIAVLLAFLIIFSIVMWLAAELGTAAQAVGDEVSSHEEPAITSGVECECICEFCQTNNVGLLVSAEPIN